MNEGNEGLWGILVFPAVALVIAIAIIWWTLPRRRPKEGEGRRDDE